MSDYMHLRETSHENALYQSEYTLSHYELFSDWWIEYNSYHGENPCPNGKLLLLACGFVAVLTICGEKYPSKTLLLWRLQWYMKK